MALTFVALRAAVFAAGFFWLWIWVGQGLTSFDVLLAGPLPEWCRAVALVMLVWAASWRSCFTGAALPRYSTLRGS